MSGPRNRAPGCSGATPADAALLDRGFDAARLAVVAVALGFLGLAKRDACVGDAGSDQRVTDREGALLGELRVLLRIAGLVVVPRDRDAGRGVRLQCVDDRLQRGSAIGGQCGDAAVEVDLRDERGRGGRGGDRSGGVFLFGLPPGTPLTTRPDSRVSVSIEGDLTFRRLRLFLNFFCHFNQNSNPERKIIKEKFNEIQVKLK